LVLIGELSVGARDSVGSEFEVDSSEVLAGIDVVGTGTRSGQQVDLVGVARLAANAVLSAFLQ
jgi:hypothetical protein